MQGMQTALEIVPPAQDEPIAVPPSSAVVLDVLTGRRALIRRGDGGALGVQGPPVFSKPTLCEMRSLFVIVFVLRSAEFLGESDEKPFGPADIAEPIRVFILNYFAYELRAALAEPFKRLVDVVHGEHDAEVA